MASIFTPAHESVHNLVNHAIRQWYPELLKAKVEIGVLFAISARETQPALKENGHPVPGTIKIVSPKDRISKKYDVELILDGDEWGSDSAQHQLAKIDSFLARLEIKKPKPKKPKKSKATVHGNDEENQQHQPDEFMVDDAGRPKLRLRKGDWNAGYGSREVVERHGQFAPEVLSLDKAQAVVQAALQFHRLSRQADKITAEVA
jgi:hypothetical protein